jgi:hypothetical protein
MATHAVSDGYLQTLWRKYVKARDNYTCIICGKKDTEDNLQAHHIVHRRQRLLRHDAKNGVTVHTVNCHEYADSLRGRKEIAAKLGAERVEYLEEREQHNVKDFLVASGMTRKELEIYEKENLKKLMAELEAFNGR